MMHKNRFHELPPLKRFRIVQDNVTEHQQNSCLPAKKRKESRDFSPPNSTSNTYCLPAKKRVWAIQPFDLNLEYEPESENAPKSQVAKEIQNLDSSKIQESLAEDEIKEEKTENEDAADNDEDGIVCAICESTDGEPSDPIVLCDGCDLMVHTSCYGHPFTNGVPDGDWFCAQCLASQATQSVQKTDNSKKAKPFSCCLCPVSGGAMKPTTDGKWAHVVCAFFVPEVFFEDPEGKQGIDIGQVPGRRRKQRCYICKSKNGCAIDCSELKCPLAFHVTCGLKEDLCIDYSEGRSKAGIVAGFCRSHTDLWIKQQRTGKFKIVARDNREK